MFLQYVVRLADTLKLCSGIFTFRILVWMCLEGELEKVCVISKRGYYKMRSIDRYTCL